MEYPVLEKYKYLGFWLSKDQGIKDHLIAINSKFQYLNRKLLPLRILDKLRLNANLFQTIVTPQYRLALANYNIHP